MNLIDTYRTFIPSKHLEYTFLGAHELLRRTDHISVSDRKQALTHRKTKTIHCILFDYNGVRYKVNSKRNS